MTSTDYLLDGRVKITQSPGGYRAGLDAVLLAAACPAKSKDSVLDLGCGAGAAGLCLAARVKDIHITGIEIQPEQAELAKLNFQQNGFPLSLDGLNACVQGGAHAPGEGGASKAAQHSSTPLIRPFGAPSPSREKGKFEIITADITEYEFPSDHFNHVILNPPYHDADQHMPPENAARATAFMAGDIGAWITAARRTVKTHGSVTIIHRADAVMEILAQMQNFGAVEIIPLWPRAGLDASRIIIRAIKGRKTPPRLRPGITLHTADGSETAELRNILRSGDSIA
jgi:tRNA1(Val) A37 N6-methylase TrmN6